MKLKALFKVRLVLSSFLLLSHAVGQNNTEPLNMGPIINSGARDAEPTFTSDGQTMYFNCFDRKGRLAAIYVLLTARPTPGQNRKLSEQ